MNPRTFYVIQELFEMARRNPRNSMNEPDKLTGRHCVARKLKAQGRRQRGRVKANKRYKEGRAVYQPD